MNKLRLDLETLEVERLDVSATGLNGGVELLGMGHASRELSQSCVGDCSAYYCACDGSYCSASCDSNSCECYTGEPPCQGTV